MASTAELTQVGKREDIADIIAIADAKSTPFKSMIRKGKKVTNTFFQWQLDGYDSPNTAGTLDGADVTTFEDAASHRALTGVYVQELRRSPKVNHMAEQISDVAGINSPDPQGVRGSTEFARAKAKKMVEIGRDMEAVLLSANETQQESGVNPYLTRGIGKFIQNGAQAVHPIPAAYRTPAASVYSGTIAAFDENALRALLQSRWDTVGSQDSLQLICGSGVKNQVTDFGRFEPNVSGALQVRRFTNTDACCIKTAVDIYSGDYGTVEIFLSNFMPTPRTGYILDMKGLEVRTLGNPTYKDLPDLGGGPRGFISALIGLCVYNPLSHCKIDAAA